MIIQRRQIVVFNDTNKIMNSQENDVLYLFLVDNSTSIIKPESQDQVVTVTNTPRISYKALLIQITKMRTFVAVTDIGFRIQ